MCVFSFQTHYTISHALARLGTPYLEGVGAREYWMLPNFLPLALRMFWYGNNIWTNNNVVGSSTTIPAGLVCLRLPRYHTKAACHHPIWIRSLTHRTVLSYIDVLYSTAEQITVCILWNSSSTHHSSACYPLLTGHHKDSPALSESCAVFAQCVMCGKCFEYRCINTHSRILSGGESEFHRDRRGWNGIFRATAAGSEQHLLLAVMLSSSCRSVASLGLRCPKTMRVAHIIE